MKQELKEVLKRAVAVAEWRNGDISTEDGNFATTDVDEMIHLQDAIILAFESYDMREIMLEIDQF